MEGIDGKVWPIGALAAALAKAQMEMQNPAFDAANPHFKNKFASLAAVRNAVIPCLAKNGISLCQDLTSVEGGVACRTILSHASGEQMIFGPLVMPAQGNSQVFGSASTYAKRYSMMAVCAVVGDTDDDAEAAVGRNGNDKLNGLPRIDPRGEGYKTQDTSKAEQYASLFRTALQEDSDTKLKELHAECNAQPDFYILVSTILKPAECAKIKQRLGFGQSSGPRGIRQ